MMQDCEKAIVEIHLSRLFARCPALSGLSPDFFRAVEVLVASLRNGGTLYLCGNGGSAADAEHIVGELMKGFLQSRRLPQAERNVYFSLLDKDEKSDLLVNGLQLGLRAVSLVGHPALTTALSNDNDAALIFAQPLSVWARPGDVLLAISTSGNADNVELAARVARVKRASVIGLTGASGGRLKKWSDVWLGVPETSTFLVQELHQPLYHALSATLEEIFFVQPD